MGLVSGLGAYVTKLITQVTLQALRRPRPADVSVWLADLHFPSQKENGLFWGGLQERVNIYFEGEFGKKNEKLRILVLVLGCFIFPFKDNWSITVNRDTYEITYYLGILPFKVIKTVCYGAIYNNKKTYLQ